MEESTLQPPKGLLSEALIHTIRVNSSLIGLFMMCTYVIAGARQKENDSMACFRVARENINQALPREHIHNRLELASIVFVQEAEVGVEWVHKHDRLNGCYKIKNVKFISSKQASTCIEEARDLFSGHAVHRHDEPRPGQS